MKYATAIRVGRLRGSDVPVLDVGWAHSESPAFASLLSERTTFQPTGRNVERRAFSQRLAGSLEASSAG